MKLGLLTIAHIIWPGAEILTPRYRPAMKMVALQSGSNGNCIYVEADGVRLLFDAGISGRQAELRLATHGRDIRDVDALVISHDHSDHARCMGIYQRKYGLPVHVTRRTFAASRARHDLGKIPDVRLYTVGGVWGYAELLEALANPSMNSMMTFCSGPGRSIPRNSTPSRQRR
jgi:glyoxylase-like metal-dependent hydrolase (beta-lactamase superfamily II)